MRFKSSLAWLLGVSLMTSCQSETAYADYLLRTPNDPIVVEGQEINEPGFQAFLGKLSTFGANLTAGFHQQFAVTENSSVSPLSIYMALALVIECSHGPTQQEILDAFDMDITEVRAYTPLLYALTNEVYQMPNQNGDLVTQGMIDLSNSLWFDEQLTLKDAVLDILAEDYHAYPFAVNFADDNLHANELIQEFIKEKTRGLIDQNFSLDPSTLIALINTLYLKDIWNNPGEDLSFTNENYTFTMGDGTTKTLPLLQGYYVPGNIYQGENYQSFFTRTTNGYQIKFILPNTGYELSDVFTSANLETVNAIRDYHAENDATMERMNTRVLFPEFDAGSDEDIKPVLQNTFDIQTLFSATCDFTPISDRDMYCEKVIHKTVLTVDKTGIEGAAVTIVQMCETSMPIETYDDIYQDFIIDRDFAYVVTNCYHVPLFSGIVQVL